ncbi:anaphase-promoting complex subunit 1 [Oncorhynchus keta]|uniref:anaphase-promoting complex subunit 1 n=1 Tax=Oncorhynchus keta TaxID=8018 RepID=UPI00227B92B1|nr:anaphase-promoting complex subunit 1 [Oncorhynchus keta]
MTECWLLRKGSSVDSDENEEELYAAGNMVIGSRGNKSQASHVYKAFTVGSPVLQDVMEQTVCIVPSSYVNVHSVTPKDLISPLHFQVFNVWPTKFGLLLERKKPCTRGSSKSSRGTSSHCIQYDAPSG